MLRIHKSVIERQTTKGTGGPKPETMLAMDTKEQYRIVSKNAALNNKAANKVLISNNTNSHIKAVKSYPNQKAPASILKIIPRANLPNGTAVATATSTNPTTTLPMPTLTLMASSKLQGVNGASHQTTAGTVSKPLSNIVTLMTNVNKMGPVANLAAPVPANNVNTRVPLVLSKATVENLKAKLTGKSIQFPSNAVRTANSNTDSRSLIVSTQNETTPQQAEQTVLVKTTKAIPSNVATVTLNGSKVVKLQAAKDELQPRKYSEETYIQEVASSMPTTSDTTMMRMQRSKSLAGAGNGVPELSGLERRHSLAAVGVDDDCQEQIKAIETITIDDDTEDEQDLPVAPLLTAILKQTESIPHIKDTLPAVGDLDCSNNSSDVEEVFLAVEKPTEASDAKKPEKPQPKAAISIVKAETLSVSKEDFQKTLQCEEQFNATTSSAASSASNNSFVIKSTPNVAPAYYARHTPNANAKDSNSLLLNPLSSKPFISNPIESSIRALKLANESFKRKMQTTFGMVRWNDHKTGAVISSKMLLELNSLNLVQINERSLQRVGPASYYKQPISDRKIKRTVTSSSHQLVYLCNRCNCHGSAAEFLAPRFCSLSCVHGSQKSYLHEVKANPNHTQLAEKKSPKDGIPAFTVTKALKPFRWNDYLNVHGNGPAAPIHLFFNPFPISPNCFERGMALEAIDPENCSLFCVCVITKVSGYRLKLSFNGYPAMYDFWINADSMDIFPPGWCENTGRVLQPPKGYTPETFNWSRYLTRERKIAAPRALFTHLNQPLQNGVNAFKTGMHLEAEDLNDTGKICVATIADIIDERIRVHFDGWDDCYDFWVHISSPYIHPCGWHRGRQQLIVPPDYQNSTFNWTDYIRHVGGIAAPAKLFAPREPMEFQQRMQLEVVDQRNPCLIRPATVIARKGFRVQLHLDCWPSEYYFWLEDDSPDLHPVGWCEATSHELEAPPGFEQPPPEMPCDTVGCRGFGNAKRFNLNIHALRDCCPYAPENWRQWRAKTVKPPRVLPEDIVHLVFKSATARAPKQRRTVSLENTACESKAKRRKANPISQPASEPNTQPAVPTKILQAVQIKTEPHEELHIMDTRAFAELSKPTQTMEMQQIIKNESNVKVDIDPRSFPIAKAFVENYGPQFVHNYKLWQINCDFDMNSVQSNPIYWSTTELYEYLQRALKSKEIAKALFDEDICGRGLLSMTRNDLSDILNLKLGPTTKLFSIIVNLRIAVVCKFNTTAAGLFDKDLLYAPENKPGAFLKHERTSNNANIKIEENGIKHGVENNDDDDVVLDNEDFLSVKSLKRKNFVQCLNAATDSDVVMTVLPTAAIATAS